ncbi:AMP-binding protein [Streptomyces sp. UNOC14_S4]|uniref:AMP-binding protein n=1 Tax=Streptomyces sp. UNOC14_S4 TaxID=2872340 RepID=UPI001E3CA0FD|nr:AMP-binding protein [Streptomyces sp. UNOC14_S4]MCC3769315.1 AMP-binding protein [Streptomyces sp. UNOC14_S4]
MNLLDSVRDAVRGADPGHGVHFLSPGGTGVTLPYDTFLRTSAWLGRKMPEDAAVVIAANDPLPTLLAFFGALWAGSRPLILPSPRALGGTERFRGHVGHVLRTFPGEAVLALQEGLVQEDFTAPVVPLPGEADGYDTLAPGELPTTTGPGGDAVAFLQATSASTGDPKLLAISHANVCANLAALRVSLGAGRHERMVSWLPLYHDMGLVGTALLSFFHGWPLHLMKPTEFVMRPREWILALSRHRATITAAPNFGYDHAYRAVDERDLTGCDLSALRCAVIGAEPIRLATMDGFHRRYRPYGLSPSALVCSYGMAESTLASSMPVPGSTPRYVLVDPTGMEPGTPVRLLGEGLLGGPPPQGHGIPVFSLGRALDGLDARLTDDDGRPVEEETVLGEIVLRGTSIAAGYVDPATGRPRPFPDGLLRTGDLGFRHRGDLFVLERRKHVVIRQGRNHLAALLEEQVAGILGHPAHEIIVLDADIHDPASDITVVVEHYGGTPDVTTAQAAALRDLDLPVDVLLFAHRRVIPRTTSGKKRYHTTRQRLADGSLKAEHLVRPAHAH